MQQHATDAIVSERAKKAACKQSTDYFNNLTKDEIIQELHERQVKFYQSNLKQNLQTKLEAEVQGKHRVPAILFQNPSKTLADMNLENYECFGCEPLHCIAGHIKNLYEEIPYHLDKEEKMYFVNIVSASFSGKEAKRGADYRLSLIDVTADAKGKIPEDVYFLLTSLREMQEILYFKENKRTNENILRLYNVTFLHALKMTEVFKVTKKLTQRRLFGQYYHSLVSHAPEQYRIISGRASNTEDEERIFNFFKTISASTSNHHPDNVILNAIIRLQVKNSLESRDSVSDVESKIMKHSNASLVKKCDTLFSFKFIEEKPWLFQSHLERIADFVLEKYWEEKDSGIIFFDIMPRENLKKKHHFRSFTIDKEISYVKNCWIKCTHKPDEFIPAKKIKVENESKVTILNLNTLSVFKNEHCQSFDDSSEQSEITTMSPVSKLVSSDQNTLDSLSPVSRVLDSSKNTLQSSSLLSQSKTPLAVSFIPNSKDSSIEQQTPAKKTKIDFNKISCSTPKVSVKITTVLQLQPVENKTNTTRCLEAILGQSEDSRRYDLVRKNYKTNPELYKNELKTLNAKFEVKLKIAYEKVRKDLRAFEMTQLEKNKTFNVKPNSESERTEYKNLLKKIEKINALKKHFEF